MVRLSEADRAKALAEAGAKPFAPGGRPMREYVVLPPAIVADKREARHLAQARHRPCRDVAGQEAEET